MPYLGKVIHNREKLLKETILQTDYYMLVGTYWGISFTTILTWYFKVILN